MRILVICSILATAVVWPAAAQAPTDSKKTITFVGGGYTATTEAYWKDLAAKFSAANPGYTVNVRIIDWNNIDQQVATEDEDFYSHHGIDSIGLGRALLYDVTNLCLCEGGSTITEQPPAG